LVANRRTLDEDQPRLINWGRVRRTAASLVRRSREPAPTLSTTELRWRYADWVRRSETLIAEYAGTSLPRPLDAIYVFDRLEWIDANVGSFARLFEPMEELYARLFDTHQFGAQVMGRLNQTMLSGQLGLLLGYMAQRVLGQYDLSLLGREPIE